MADQRDGGISWTDETLNPIRARHRVTGKVGWHCEHVTEACRNCYAEAMNNWVGTQLDYKPGHRKDLEIFLDEDLLMKPLRWRRPRNIFVCSMTDLFADFVTDEQRDKVFAMMALAGRHTFQLLTKRWDLMHDYLVRLWSERATQWLSTRLRHPAGERSLFDLLDTTYLEWPLRNVWTGISAGTQEDIEAGIVPLLKTPSALHWISAEPILGPLDVRQIRISDGLYLDALTGAWSASVDFPGFEHTQSALKELAAYLPLPPRLPGLKCVVVGGESGRHARAPHPDWFRALRDQCPPFLTAFHFKQWGEWIPAEEIDDGKNISMVPDDGGDHERLCDLGRRPVRRLGGGVTMWRVGKHHAGRLLDGVLHDAMPQVAA